MSDPRPDGGKTVYTKHVRSSDRVGMGSTASANPAGEASVYTILAFVAMKMEMSWRNAPFRNSGFRKLKPFAGYFTHES